METLRCDPCGKSFTGQICYKQHLESEKHKRKLLNFGHFSSSSEASPQVQSTQKYFESVLKNSESSQKTFECPVCNIIFNSLSNFQTHSISPEHAQKVIEKNSDNSKSLEFFRSLNRISHCEDSSSSENVHDGANDNIFPPNEMTKSQTLTFAVSSSENVRDGANDNIFPPFEMTKSQTLTFAVCNICNKMFSGPEPYKQHLVSVAHKKKVDLEKSGALNQTTSQYSCSPCKKVFSGQVPYMQHVESEIHKKKILSIQFLQKETSEIDSASVIKESKAGENNQSNPWFCKICQTQCSGYIPYQQHLQGIPHLKKAKRQNLNFNAVSSEQIALQNKNIDKDTVDAYCMVNGSNVQINNGNGNMDASYVLPDMSQEDVLKIEDLSVKTFLPNETIDFDNPLNKMDTNSLNKEICASENGQKLEITESDHETCDICKVDLESKEETVDHFQSLEHFSKKNW